MMSTKADYGQDAPGIRLGMICLGSIGVAAFLGMTFGGSYIFSPPVFCALKLFYILIAAYGGGMAIYMTWGSRVGKIRTCERLLEELGRIRPWTGDETVVDIGCGRGLMLLKAARKLTTGKAVGFDIWRSSDQAGNSAEATFRNAEIEGVSDRVDIKTGNATKLPIETASCDVVLSNWVIHNIEEQHAQLEALQEMWRVCLPGGAIIVSDIANVLSYSRFFSSLGATNVRFLDGGVEALIANIFSAGTYKPQALILIR